jgi:hypothetical protein
MPGTAVAQLSRIAVDPKNQSLAASHRPGLQGETISLGKFTAALGERPSGDGRFG